MYKLKMTAPDSPQHAIINYNIKEKNAIIKK